MIYDHVMPAQMLSCKRIAASAIRRWFARMSRGALMRQADKPACHWTNPASEADVEQKHTLLAQVSSASLATSATALACMSARNCPVPPPKHFQAVQATRQCMWTALNAAAWDQAPALIPELQPSRRRC